MKTPWFAPLFFCLPLGAAASDPGWQLLRPQGGAIALQAHDDQSTFYFREIKIRRLPQA